MQIDVILYRSLPPLPGGEDILGPAQNFCADRDPVAEEAESNSDEGLTPANILKKKKDSNDSKNVSPDPKPSSFEGQPKGIRAVAWKHKASTPANTRNLLCQQHSFVHMQFPRIPSFLLTGFV